MSPNTDAYWVGALSMTAARAHHLILSGRSADALQELHDVLTRLNESPVMNRSLRLELAPYWPREEQFDDRDVLRPLRGVD